MFRHAIDVKKREPVANDHIVKEAYGEGNGFSQSGEVDAGACSRSCNEVGHVDGAEGAGLKSQERLFTAGVGRLDGAKARGGIGPIDRVQKDQAGLAAGPSRFDKPIEYELCREPPGLFIGMGIDQGIGATAGGGLPSEPAQTFAFA